MKRLVSILLIFSFLVSISVASAPYKVKADASDTRGGFVLTPSSSDSTGVNVDSTYTLESQNSITADELRARLSIDNEPAPIINEQSPGIFKIELSRSFEQDKLYTFRIKDSGNDDITWTFQTSTTFKIESVLPADQSTVVPVNTGIEINFSHENYENIDDYFEITPAVKGKFERHKKVYVFVPKALKYGTVYTVKIRAGVKLNGTDYKLSDDYSFSFETASKSDDDDNREYAGYFSYNKNLNEFSTSEKPKVPLNYYVNREYFKAPVITIENIVYSYSDIDSFIEALEEHNKIPMWAYYNYANNPVKTDGLTKVVSFDQILSREDNNPNFVNVPQKLPAGYYLLDSTFEDINFQTFIEVTDVGIYIMKSTGKTLIWLNDLSNKASISGATITDVLSNEVFKTNSTGIAYFNTPENTSASDDVITSDESKAYFKIKTTDNKTAVLNYYSYLYKYYRSQGTDNYWNYLFLDRGIYKPDDSVKLWGMIKNRYSADAVDSVTVEISRGYNWYGYYSMADSNLNYSSYGDQPIVSATLSVENGIYKGSLDLPSPDADTYRVVVKNGDEVISSTYITVENYTKPAYRIETTSDKNAIFADQSVNFNVKASFFEGTGLPKLSLSYDFDNSFGSSDVSGTKTTSIKGIANIKYSPRILSNSQGEGSATLNIRSSLPEIGQITSSNSVRVFVNDIDVQFDTDIEDSGIKISSTVKNIVPDRLNDGTSKDYYDYLGTAVASKILSGSLYKNTWVRTENGTYYDYINKKTETIYEYNLKKDKVDDFTMTTDSTGKASYSFNVTDTDDIYYTAEMNCIDNSGRNMNFDIYISDNYLYETGSYWEDNRYKLTGNEKSYGIDDTVDLTYKKGTADMPSGRYIFIKSQNGLRDYAFEDGPNYSFKYKESDVPNIFVTGIYFNGLTYVESEIYNAVFDSKTRELLLTAKTDKDSYKPGDMITVNVSAKDKLSNPKKAIVNLSMVDEALFSLQEQYVDTLASLYQTVPSGIDLSYSSHLNSKSDNYGIYGYVMKDMAYNSAFSLYDRPDPTSPTADTVRENFKDTAFFDTVTLDENGNGQFTFKLPDNITSWRITLNGVTDNLLGGSNSVNLDVTMPFFINYTLNTTYLAGDKPVIGVNAYGTGLAEDQEVTFTVSDSSGKTITAKGNAFDRVDIPLWELKTGTESITVRASAAGGLTDAVKHNITVSDTYHEYNNATYKNLANGIKFTPGTKGTAKIIFTDRSRGSFLPALTSLMYESGDRIDQQLSAKVSHDLIDKYFPAYLGDYETTTPDISDYQKSNGGIAILPYASSDVDLSAKLTSLIKDDVNVVSLKNYFYSILEKNISSSRGNALYGLAVLREPVLLDMDRIASIDNLSVKELIYIALAYCELGETAKATEIYKDRILSHVKKMSPYYKVSVGVDNDDILECTSLASILASKLEMPERKGLYNYCLKNSTDEILINIEKLLYISNEIENYTAVSSKFTYTLYGVKHNIDLSNGNTFVLKVAAKNLDKVVISNVSGVAGAVAIKKVAEYSAKELDDDISVSRKYSVYKSTGASTTSFKQNDIVKVTISWKLGKKAMDGNYEISDYLPSGLKPIENPWQFGQYSFRCWYFRNIDGQKVTFYAYKYKKSYQPEPFVYYARVISAGTFKADSPTIQSLKSSDIINVSKAAVITIK